MSNNLNSNKALLNKKCYKNKLEDVNTIIFEYVKILHEYLTHITKMIEIKEYNHYRYIILRGYDLLKNVFLFLMFYTKNTELVNHHLRKSYLYYTEFIGQIGEDSNSYLQLNSKDACLFVYKKTIHEIDEDIRKKYELSVDSINIHEELKQKILLINRIESFFVRKNIKYFIKKNDDELVNNVRVKIVKILEGINNIPTEKILKKMEKINLFISFLEYNFDILEEDILFSNIITFIKRIKKTDIDDNKLKKINIVTGDLINTLTPKKFINKLFRAN